MVPWTGSWTHVIFAAPLPSYRSWPGHVLARREYKDHCPRPQGSRECPPDSIAVGRGWSHYLPQRVRLTRVLLIRRWAIVVTVRNHHRHCFADELASLGNLYFLASGFLDNKYSSLFGFQ